MNDLFDFEPFRITKPIRLIELFGGIGSQAMALRNIGADFEHWRLVEFDRFAVASYNAIHGTDFTPRDIREIHASDLGIADMDKFEYVMTYSFPCQDLSVAGKGAGMAKGSGTRSGLLWEVQRILEECEELPQILLMENVPQVHGKKNKADFDTWIDFLRGKGYQSFWQDLNAKDYGIPQNRVRCFMASILSDEPVAYDFPEKTELKKAMKDLLEEHVDEKYYINNEKADKLVNDLLEKGKIGKEPMTTVDLCLKNPGRIEVANCIKAKYDAGISNPTISTCGGGNRQPKIIEKARCVGGLGEKKSNGKRQFYQQDMVYSSDGVAMCHPANLPGGSYSYLVEEEEKMSERQESMRAKKLPNGNIRFYRNDERKSGVPELQLQDPEGVAQTITAAHEPKIIDIYNNNVLKGNICGTITASGNASATACGTFWVVEEDKRIVAMRGRNPENPMSRKEGAPTEQRLEPNANGTTNALTTVQKDNLVLEETRSYRIRKLTPLEVWRLMGFNDRDFEAAASVCSNTQLYKQAGNSIVVNVLEAIFRQMM